MNIITISCVKINPKAMNNKKIHLTEEQVAFCAELLAEGRMQKVPVDMKRHLAECIECAQQVLMVAEVISDIDQKEFQSALTNENGNEVQVFDFRRRFYKYAGMAAAILILLSLVLFLRNPKMPLNSKEQITELSTDSNNPLKPKEELGLVVDSSHLAVDLAKHQVQSEEISKKENVQVVKDSKKIAYAESEDLEALVMRFSEGNLRSSTEMNSSSVIAVAKDSDLVLRFENSQNKSLTVEVFDANNQRLTEMSTSIDSLHVAPFDKIGNYYWKLLNEDFDLLFCGKIEVR